MANSVPLPFPANATVFVQGFANAAFTQAITIRPPSGSSAVFSGSGENNAILPLTTQGFLTPHAGGQPSFKVPSSGGTYTVSVTANGQPSQVMGTVSNIITPAGGQILLGWVSSEDAQDQDWNDSVLIFTSYIPA
jgi:fucose-binding lectin II (PA-IIL)